MYVCMHFVSDSQLLSTGSWSKRITVSESRKGPKLKISCISMEYGIVEE